MTTSRVTRMSVGVGMAVRLEPLDGDLGEARRWPQPIVRARKENQGAARALDRDSGAGNRLCVLHGGAVEDADLDRSARNYQ